MTRSAHERLGSAAGWHRARRVVAEAAAMTLLVTTVVLAVTTTAASALTQTFTNATQIDVPTLGPLGPGPADLYPSPITVSGMPGHVTDVNVTLNSVSHGRAADLDIFLVGPSGENLMVMSDVAASGLGVNGTLTFDDAAAAPISQFGSVGTGTFKPTNSGAVDSLASPAPPRSGATALNEFNGTDPNGVWNLFVFDDLVQNQGRLTGGWTLEITSEQGPVPGVIQVTTTSGRGAEGEGPVTLTLERIRGSDGPVSVLASAMFPTSATADSDYQGLPQTVTFADGETSASFSITILDDAEVEGVDESITVGLGSPGGGATLGRPTTAVVAIEDNDAMFNATPIAIPAGGPAAPAGSVAAPYPSNIRVQGQPNTILGVEVTLQGFRQNVPIHADILLVGPGGQNIVLMSDTGGVIGVGGLTLTFSDQAAGGIPIFGQLRGGTYRPTDFEDDSFPAPAPALSGATELSTFSGTNPNGIWSLYIVSDTGANSGGIDGGWSLRFLTPIVATAGGPYLIGEGDSLQLDASATSAPEPATFAWDLDGDGIVQTDDATGPTPLFPPAAVQALGLGDGDFGPRVLLVRVTAPPNQNVVVGTTVRIFNRTPVPSVGTVPTDILPGTPASVTFSATDPSQADTVAGFTYNINWGDGTSIQSVTGGTSVTVAHTWATAGPFTISLTATDRDGDTSPQAATALVNVSAPIMVDAGGPYSVSEGGDLVLDGTGSQVSTAAMFAWDVDNDTQFDDATGATPTISAATLQALGIDDGPSGPLNVALQVVDGFQTDTDTATLNVANGPPTATPPVVPTAVFAGAPATVTFGATDPSTADSLVGFTYAIDWGDGSSIQTVSGGATVRVSHTYAAPGPFAVNYTAIDKDGGTSAFAATPLTVGAVFAGGPYSIAEGGDLLLAATGSVAGPAATFEWDVDNDGQFDDATGPAPTIAAATLQALGLDDGPAGPLIVTLRVTDGTASDTDNATLSIRNTRPTATPPVATSVVEGTLTTATFAATDPSATDTAAGFTYAIDWGDLIPQVVTGGASVNVTHTYATDGTFTIRVTATDKDGGTSDIVNGTAIVAPLVIADAGGSYLTAEGENLELDATGTAAGPTATYEWDLDGDTQLDDATGPTPVLTPDQLAPLGLADGPAGPLTLTLRVTEGITVATATATFEITNVAPVATVQMLGPIVAGVPSTVKVGANDPSPTDAAGTFEYRIDWDGDGTIDEVLTGPADPPATHTYPSAGDVGLSVIAVDKDGAASDPTVSTITVDPAPPPSPGSSPTTPTTPGTTDGTTGVAGATGTGGAGGSTGGVTTGSELARTGIDAALGGIGLGLMFTGIVLVAVTRRRRLSSS